MLGLELIVVHAEDNGEILPLGRLRDNDLLRSCLDMRFGLFALGKESRRLENDLGPDFSPGQLSRVALGDDADGFSVYD